MGFKSKNNQSNICKGFKVGGLIFDSEEDYKILKNIDININQTVRLVKDGFIDLNNVFNNIKTINVEETYPDAREELDNLFKNATELLIYEDTIDYKVSCCFFKKFNIIVYPDIDDNL